MNGLAFLLLVSPGSAAYSVRGELPKLQLAPSRERGPGVHPGLDEKRLALERYGQVPTYGPRRAGFGSVELDQQDNAKPTRRSFHGGKPLLIERPRASLIVRSGGGSLPMRGPVRRWGAIRQPKHGGSTIRRRQSQARKHPESTRFLDVDVRRMYSSSPKVAVGFLDRSLRPEKVLRFASGLRKVAVVRVHAAEADAPLVGTNFTGKRALWFQTFNRPSQASLDEPHHAPQAAQVTAQRLLRSMPTARIRKPRLWQHVHL